MNQKDEKRLKLEIKTNKIFRGIAKINKTMNYINIKIVFILFKRNFL